MAFTQIKETCLYVNDLDQTAEFYLNILELPLISRSEGRHIFFRCGSSVLLCFLNTATIAEETLPPHYAVGRQHLAFEVTVDEYEGTRT